MRKGLALKYVVYRDANNHWRWRLVTANNRIIANSGEGYFNKGDCIHAINLVAGSTGTPIQYV